MRRALVRALAFLTLGLFVYSVRSVLPPFIMGAFLAYVLEPPVSYLVRKGWRRVQAILLVYALLASVLALVILYFVPGIVEDLRSISADIPRLISLVQRYARDAKDIVVRYNLPSGVERSFVDGLESLAEALSTIGDKAFLYFMSSATAVAYVVIAPVIAYYILRDMNRWRRSGLVYFSTYPLPYVDLVREIDRVLGGFVRGQAIVGFAVAVMIWIGGTVLRLKHSLFFGLIAGLGEFVPVFGPIVAALPFLLSAFLKSVGTGLWAIGLIVLVQWIDSNLIVPNVTGPRVGLHPLLIMFALLAGGRLLGFWGVLLAVPLAGTIKAVAGFVASLWSKGTGD